MPEPRSTNASAAVRAAASAQVGEERFRLLIEHAADDFFMHDDQGRFIDVNEHACASTGYTREEMLRLSVCDIAGVSREYAQEVWDRTPPGFSSLEITEHRRKDGSTFPVEMRISCQLIDGSKIFFGMGRNITDRLAAEERIRELNAQLEQRVAETAERSRQSTNLLQSVMNATPDPVYVKDLAGRYLFLNRAAARVLTGDEQKIADVVDSGDREFFPTAVADAITDNDERVVTDGESLVLEEQILVDGALRPFLASKAPYRDDSGAIIGIVGVAHDLSEFKRAEAALRNSEARWQFALDAADVGIWDWNLATGEVFYSHTWKALLGFDDADIGTAAEEWSSRIHPDDLQLCMDAIEQHLRGETPGYTCEHRMQAKDGSWRWIYGRARAIERDAAGAPLRVVGTMADITERWEHDDAIRRLNEKLQLANRVGGIGIWEITDVANRRVVWDEQMHALYGFEVGEFTGEQSQWFGRLHPDDVVQLGEDWAGRLPDPAVPMVHNQFRAIMPDGEVRHIRSQARVFRDEDGAVTRMLGVAWDITEETLAAEALRQAKDAAENAERAKSEFLAMMSHEIRTPMNGVLGMTRLALQSDLPAKARDYLEKVDRSAQNLIGIINDILDFSKVEAGKIELEQAEFPLESMLESVSTVTAIKAEQKGLEIGYSVAENVPARVIGDSLRLSQVLINLVDNAIKFTDIGEVIVSIEATGERADDHTTLRFTVRDTGIGLDDEQRANLFQAFSQADSGVARRYGGTGLGLAICRQIVELMGGQIGVRSSPGGGSTFEFTAVLGRPAQHPARHSARLAGKRVLVTDDSATAREILAPMLRGFGLDVTAAESGGAALDLLADADRRREPYDLVLMDWQMPGMDGLEVARRIRETPSLQRIPAVLMVTAYGRAEVLRRTEQLGLQGVLIKPVTHSTMFETVADILDGRDPDRPDGWAAGPARAIPAGLAGRRVLVVDDNSFNREVAAGFLAAAEVHTVTAVDGTDAIARLRQGSFDAVLMDVQMPGMDGYTTTRAIRAEEQWADLPIIALTAHARPEDRHRSIDAGMTGHLTKPIDDAELYATLAELLGAAQTGPAADPTSDESVPAASSDGPADSVPGGVDLPGALAQLGGRHDLYQRLIRSFLDDFGRTPEQIAEFWRSGRADAIVDRAHAVRGAAAYLHADALHATATDLEDRVRRSGLDSADALVTRFVDQMHIVLATLTCALDERPAEPATMAVRDTAGLLRLIDSVRVLVATGDYGAQSLLTEIDTRVAGSVFAEPAARVHRLFDRLDLDDAQVALQQFRDAVGAERGDVV